MPNRLSRIVPWLQTVAMDRVGALGIILATLGGGLFFILILLGLLGVPFSQYIGIFIYLVLPLVLLVGLILIPIGRWRISRHQPGHRPPAFDLANPKHAKALGFFLGLSVVKVLIFGVAGYEAFHLSESNEFCGTMCHTVMQPEWTAYQGSPHSRVKCVECHIGPGTDWFVRSKLSGARQVLAVALGTYDRPIEVPVEHLRPARETCEQCHWPEKFHGDRVQVIHHYEKDRENTELTTALILRVGGGAVAGEVRGGIHWHTSSENTVTYVSTDRSREEIPWVRLETADGQVEEFVVEDFEGLDELLASREPRTMDCVDCHNRPTHIYQQVDDAVDLALAEGLLDRGIPYVRRAAEKALVTPVGEGEEPMPRIRAALAAEYASYEGVHVEEAVLDDVARELTAIWSRNVFPAMDVTWGTYKSFLGHRDDGGCFRCHDGYHKSSSGKIISDDCETCHVLLAWEEQDPEILKEMQYGTR
jgi:hypothetical protein